MKRRPAKGGTQEDSLSTSNIQVDVPIESLCGILECPLHKGFIEFEYRPGDLVFELKEKIKSVWGTIKADKGQFWRHWEPSGWAILCQDKEGAFLALKDNDCIPIRPPAGAELVKESTMKDYERHKGIESTGTIHVRDIYKSMHHEVHIAIQIYREYEIPNKDYSIRLVALVQLRGG